MNAKDYKHLKEEIKKAEENKVFYEKLGSDYTKDFSFWSGYLNAINLLWLQAKNNYKL